MATKWKKLHRLQHSLALCSYAYYCYCAALQYVRKKTIPILHCRYKNPDRPVPHRDLATFFQGIHPHHLRLIFSKTIQFFPLASRLNGSHIWQY